LTAVKFKEPLRGGTEDDHFAEIEIGSEGGRAKLPQALVEFVRGGREICIESLRQVDLEKCNDCGVCLMIGCPAIQKKDGKLDIDVTTCMGDQCTICEQLCPKQAIGPVDGKPGR